MAEASGAQPPVPTFSDQTVAAGFDYEHGFFEADTDEEQIAGGVAAGDYDGDGDVDLYVVRGEIGPNLLYRNRGDGVFEEVGAAAGVAVDGHKGSGPTFADLDGDGRLDLVVGAVEGDQILVFRNHGDGTFEQLPDAAGLVYEGNTFSFALADYDRDGLVDLAMSHWGRSDGACTAPCTGHLWHNEGDGSFSDADVSAGLMGFEDGDFSFTPNFTDLDGDGWLDLVVAADFLTSQVWLNDRDGTFTDVTDRAVITDQNGMGAAVGDYDGDGDTDWFVSSIYGASGQGTGNRLYRNEGGGVFADVTEEAGVREGGWAWGACMADFNNDGWLDIFHTNGWSFPEWETDLSPLFLSNGDGTFSEHGKEAGISDGLQGRGVACFDADRDGDLDVFVANNSGPPVFYRNDGPSLGGSLTVSLASRGKNTHGAGARLTVTAGGRSQVREMHVGSNFASQQPPEVHFGLGASAVVDELRVEWPSGVVNRVRPGAGDAVLQIRETYDSVGLYVGETFFLRNVNTSGPADMRFELGPDLEGGAVPFAGDWDGDGIDEVGVYLPTLGRFILRDAAGALNAFAWGPVMSGWLPVAGDWNGDGDDTVGLYDPVDSRFLLLDENARGSSAREVTFAPGGVGAVPLAGDWDGDGVATPGLYSAGRFFLKDTLGPDESHRRMRLEKTPGGALPVVGDWSGDGLAGVGYYDRLSARFGLRSSLTNGPAEIELTFGGPGSGLVPIAGMWN